MPFDANDPDTKAALAEAVKAAVEEAKTGLENKNKELLSEVKELKKGRQIDPAEVEKLEAKIETLQTELTTAQKTAKDATKAAETATKALETETGFTHKLLAENGVVAALTAANVTDPAYLEAAKAMHMSQIKVVADGDVRKAMYGDKALDEAIKEWAAGEVGKKFVSAPANGGGGAQGGGQQDNTKTVTRSQFDAMDHPARASFAKDGGKVIDQAA